MSERQKIVYVAGASSEIELAEHWIECVRRAGPIGVTVNVGQVFESRDACSERCVHPALERAGEAAVHRLLTAMHGKGAKS